MAIYYVSKSGNDTTGDGSQGNPWLTVQKAYSTVSTAGGHTINVGAGTYAENTSGTGRLQLDRSFVARVTIQAESGNPDDVVLTGASGSYNLYQAGAISNLAFRNLTIQSRAGTQYAVALNPGTAFNITNLEFEGVKLIADGATGSAACVGILSNTPAAPITWGVTWKDCTVDAVGGTAAFGLRLSIPVNSLFRPQIYNLQCSAALNTGIELLRCTGFVVAGGDLRGVAGKGLLIGLDGLSSGSAAQRCTGTVAGCRISSVSGHGFLLGGDAYDCDVHGNVILGGDHGAVIKAAELCRFRENVIFAGTINAVLEKGCTNCTIARNTAIVRSATNGNAVLDNYDGDPLYVVSGTETVSNRWIADGVAKLIAWSTAGNGAGNRLDANIYEDRSSLATWGDVLGDADVTSLAEIQAALVAGGVEGAEAGGGTSGLLFSLRHSATGATLYANLFDANGNVWNGSAFGVYSPATSGALASYAIPLVENPAGSHVYSFVWNKELASGTYEVRVFSTAEYETFAVNDPLAAEKPFVWPDLASTVKAIYGLDLLIYASVA